MNPSGTASPPQRARRSAVEWIPPKLVASRTSFSAPIVSGAAAFVMASKPGIRIGQVADLLRGSAQDVGPKGYDGATGYGLVNIPAALQAPVIVYVVCLAAMAAQAWVWWRALRPSRGPSLRLFEQERQRRRQQRFRRLLRDVMPAGQRSALHLIGHPLPFRQRIEAALHHALVAPQRQQRHRQAMSTVPVLPVMEEVHAPARQGAPTIPIAEDFILVGK